MSARRFWLYATPMILAAFTLGVFAHRLLGIVTR